MGRSRFPAASRGIALLEIAFVFVIVGLMVQLVVVGEDMIRSARVRDVIAQQNAAMSAMLAFQDRYRSLPGDYAGASNNINCGLQPCLNGNGNGQIEAGTNGAIHEEILLWHHLVAAGFLQGDYAMPNSGIVLPGPGNTPRNVFGGYLEIVYDSQWGTSGNNTMRHNIKTGNQIPANVLAEVDRKSDDGLPNTGRFRFSDYSADGTPPLPGGTPNGCTDADAPTGLWLLRNGSDNCGATTLIY